MAEPDISDHIICDGKVLHVTQILYDALRTLRRATTSRLLWIDQLCINKEDVIERSCQVRLMRLIYNRADLVIAWLSPEDDYTAAACQPVHTMSTKRVSTDVSLDAEPEVIWDKQQMDAMGLPRFHRSQGRLLPDCLSAPTFKEPGWYKNSSWHRIKSSILGLSLLVGNTWNTSPDPC